MVQASEEAMAEATEEAMAVATAVAMAVRFISLYYKPKKKHFK